MKKFLKYFLFNFALLLVPNVAMACWHPWYTPGGYYMYRVYDPEPEFALDEHYPNTGRNCKEWQNLTSPTISLDDIYKVVYKMELEDFEKICNNRDMAYDNGFIDWICKKDTAILNFLHLAKTNEYIRTKYNSRWYYPTMNISAGMTIEEVAEKALFVKDNRLRDRYLLQAVRALFSMSRYEECIELWENEVSRLPENNLMRQMIQPYIAGAEFHTKRIEKAMKHFAQLGDVQSMLFCCGREGDVLSTVDALELVCEYAPESHYIHETLQSYIRQLSPDGEFYCEYKFENNSEIQRLNTLCLEMAKGGRTENLAMWYYTAAFLADLNGETAEASRLLRLAENSKSSEFIDESIKVFKIYLDAKMQPYDAAYEERLFKQLRWLDTKICDNITESVREETSSGYKLYNCEGYYYWNDMMRRILLVEVCPRMIKAGKTTRALQLANMADNRLFNLVDRHNLYDWFSGKVKTYTMNSYRYSKNENRYDYSNHFFEIIDSIGIDNAIKYVKRVNRPQDDFDRFLNSRGYIGDDYLNDILGTQCLRNMRYREAMEYLGTVSESYGKHLNVSMIYNPFSLEAEWAQVRSDFRYNFAREMYSLEQAMELTKEPNRKALLMVKYAIGIKNSFDLCWELTQYYRGTSHWGRVCEKRDWESDKYTITARRKVEEMVKSACGMFTDDEIAAETNYMLCNFKTVAEKYPETEKGILVRGKCDNLYDYHTESYN